MFPVLNLVNVFKTFPSFLLKPATASKAQHFWLKPEIRRANETLSSCSWWQPGWLWAPLPATMLGYTQCVTVPTCAHARLIWAHLSTEQVLLQQREQLHQQISIPAASVATGTCWRSFHEGSKVEWPVVTPQPTVLPSVWYNTLLFLPLDIVGLFGLEP